MHWVPLQSASPLQPTQVPVALQTLPSVPDMHAAPTGACSSMHISFLQCTTLQLEAGGIMQSASIMHIAQLLVASQPPAEPVEAVAVGVGVPVAVAPPTPSE